MYMCNMCMCVQYTAETGAEGEAAHPPPFAFRRPRRAKPPLAGLLEPPAALALATPGASVVRSFRRDTSASLCASSREQLLESGGATPSSPRRAAAAKGVRCPARMLPRSSTLDRSVPQRRRPAPERMGSSAGATPRRPVVRTQRPAAAIFDGNFRRSPRAHLDTVLRNLLSHPRHPLFGTTTRDRRSGFRSAPRGAPSGNVKRSLVVWNAGHRCVRDASQLPSAHPLTHLTHTLALGRSLALLHNPSLTAERGKPAIQCGELTGCARAGGGSGGAGGA
eukprot:scaffold89599_cov50-Phaeocystis_antarctica.AAC.1